MKEKKNRTTAHYTYMFVRKMVLSYCILRTNTKLLEHKSSHQFMLNFFHTSLAIFTGTQP